MDLAPVTWNDGTNVAIRQALQQVADQVCAQERHVARSDEDETVRCRGEPGFDTGQWSEPVRPLAGDVSDSFEPDTAISDHEHFLAAVCKRVSDALDQGIPIDLE